MELQKCASDLYQKLALIPSIDSAYLLPPIHTNPSHRSHTDTPAHTFTHIPVLIKASQTDVHQAKKRAYLLHKSISSHGSPLASSSFPFDVTSASIVSPSPSGRFLAVVRIDGDKKDEPFIEVH